MRFFTENHEIFWQKCVICQKVTKEKLKCSFKALGPNADPKAVYGSFLTNVACFKDIGELPISLALPAEVNADAFVTNKACWRISCNLQFGASKLGIARNGKRKRDAVDKTNECQVVKSRRLSVADNIKQSCICILCDEGGGKLHEVCTFATNQNLRHMITELQDSSLLPKICVLDLIASEAKYHLTCMTELRNRYGGHLRRAEGADKEADRLKESQAFVDLINYIELN